MFSVSGALNIDRNDGNLNVMNLVDSLTRRTNGWSDGLSRLTECYALM